MATSSQPTGDLSNTTVTILLLLVILVSIIGTWTVLDNAKSSSGSPEVILQAEHAEIRLMGSSVLDTPQTITEQLEEEK